MRGHYMQRRAVAALAVAGAAVAACGGTGVPQATPPPSATPTAAGPVVPWLALPASNAIPVFPTPSGPPVPPVPIPAGTPACRAAQLEMAFMGTQAAAGSSTMPFAFRNTAATACTLDGYPVVTIVDAAGRTLAPRGGPAQRGSSFDSWPSPVPVLMQPGTRPFVPPSGLGLQPVQGQALLDMSWYDCASPAAATLLLDLPGGGGRITLPFAVRAAMSPACVSPATPLHQLGVGPIAPAGYSWPPEPDYLSVDARIDAPATVRRGSTLVYRVTLTDTGTRTDPLDVCPDVLQYLGAKVAATRTQLNCAPLGSIAAGAAVTFEMHLAIPATVATGPTVLHWTLLDERVRTFPDARSAITVTA